MVSVVRDVVLLHHGRAEKARSGQAAECRLMWDRLQPMTGGFSLAELAKAASSFESYCDATAHRRIRQRQVQVLAYAAMTVLAGVPTGWLILRAFGPARPVALVAYLVTAVLLAGIAWWALHGRRVIATTLVIVAAGMAAWEFWPRPPAAWSDPRVLLTLPTTDEQRILAQVALGAELTLVLIFGALMLAIALTMVERSRLGGGSSDVRAFDHFLAVAELLVDNDSRPGGKRRPHIQEGLRTAEVALLIMARGGRPVGWLARWHGRRHHQENMRRTRKIVAEIQRPNPLAGLRTADEKLLSTTVTCLLGICRDQLGEVLTAIEEVTAEDAPPTKARTPTTRRQRTPPTESPDDKSTQNQRVMVEKAVQLGIVWIPLASLLILWHFDVPHVDIGWLWTIAMVIGVLGSFVIVMPNQDEFLTRLRRALSTFSKPLPAAKEPAAGEEAEAEDTDPAQNM